LQILCTVEDALGAKPPRALARLRNMLQRGASRDTPFPSAPSAPPAPTPALGPEPRLRTLDDLHQQGLITDTEYQAQREQVLDRI
jgi:hypothetical protein